MAVEQESVSKILSMLSHPLRREILLNLNGKGEPSFTDLLNLLEVDTGKLSFHLRFRSFHRANFLRQVQTKQGWRKRSQNRS